MTAGDSAILNALSRRQREAILARMGHGIEVVPQEEIALQFNINQSNVSRRIWGGIKTLRKRGIDVAPLMRRLNIT